MRQPRCVLGWLPLVWLIACVASHIQGPTTVQPAAFAPGPIRPALDRLLTRGDIEVATAHVQDFGFNPGLVDGIFTALT
jgi:hypothetical protein